MSTAKDFLGYFRQVDFESGGKLDEEIDSLTPDEKTDLSQKLYDFSALVYNPLLTDSISVTFSNIHKAIKKLLYQQLFLASQQFQAEPEKWKLKLAELRKIKLFEDVSDYDLFNLANVAEEIKLTKGEKFIEQHKEIKGVFLSSGIVDIFVSKNQKPLSSRSGIFGEEACLTGMTNSTITAIPEDDSDAFFIPNEIFKDLLRRVPGLQGKVYNLILERASEKLSIARKESEHASEQYRLTQEILDNLGQGSFSIDETGEIGENYTPIAAEYLDRKHLAGVPFADVLLKNDKKALRDYYRALNLLFGGNKFDPEVIISMLPNQTTINERTYKLYYTFVEDYEGFVASVFVRMDEITQALKREKQVQDQIVKEDHEKTIIEKMRHNISGYMNLLEEIEKCVQQIREFEETYIVNDEKPDSEFTTVLMRNLHTSKGVSAQFELNETRDILHSMEDCVQLIEKEGIDDHLMEFDSLRTKLNHTYDYACSLKESLGDEIIRKLQGVNFSQEEFRELLGLATHDHFDQIKQIILTKAKVPAEKIIENWESDIKRLSAKLGKKVDLVLKIKEGLMVPKEVAEVLNKELVHLYRNSVDHGVETVQNRLDAGKGESGKVIISIDEKDGRLVFSIADDGAGMDFDKIIQIAKSKKHLNLETVDKYVQENKPWKILFMPGFSSAEQVTNISGRGVGMDAVKHAILKMKGSISVVSSRGKGSRFIIKTPLSVG
ncbi:MAG: ATP-binding protein [Deltaproteobacteria bacterium]|nr:ATP-binding protein [Deltaproteobacteria bacterium]